MINKKYFVLSLLSTFLFSTAAFANNPYFELYNDNQELLGKWDTIQFRICDYHNLTSCVYSKELSAEIGKNHETFQAPSYFNGYSVQIRDAIGNYQSCGPIVAIANNNQGLLANVYGASAGSSVTCIIK